MELYANTYKKLLVTYIYIGLDNGKFELSFWSIVRGVRAVTSDQTINLISFEVSKGYTTLCKSISERLIESLISKYISSFFLLLQACK